MPAWDYTETCLPVDFSLLQEQVGSTNINSLEWNSMRYMLTTALRAVWFPGPIAKENHLKPRKVTLELNTIKVWGWQEYHNIWGPSLSDTNLFCLLLHYTWLYTLIAYDHLPLPKQNQIFSKYMHSGIYYQPESQLLYPLPLQVFMALDFKLISRYSTHWKSPLQYWRAFKPIILCDFL